MFFAVCAGEGGRFLLLRVRVHFLLCCGRGLRARRRAAAWRHLCWRKYGFKLGPRRPLPPGAPKKRRHHGFKLGQRNPLRRNHGFQLSRRSSCEITVFG